MDSIYNSKLIETNQAVPINNNLQFKNVSLNTCQSVSKICFDFIERHRDFNKLSKTLGKLFGIDYFQIYASSIELNLKRRLNVFDIYEIVIFIILTLHFDRKQFSEWEFLFDFIELVDLKYANHLILY